MNGNHSKALAILFKLREAEQNEEYERKILGEIRNTYKIMGKKLLNHRCRLTSSPLNLARIPKVDPNHFAFGSASTLYEHSSNCVSLNFNVAAPYYLKLLNDVHSCLGKVKIQREVLDTLTHSVRNQDIPYLSIALSAK